MRERLETLRRMTALYTAVEDIHSTELRRRTAAVQEAQRAITCEKEAERTAALDGRGALLTGDRESWVMAGRQRSTSTWRRGQLEKIRLIREQLNHEAKEQLVSSRLKKEQMKQVSDDLAGRLTADEGRRIQAASDDRFLARTRWADAQEKRRVADE
jgi:hypothetical protein